MRARFEKDEEESDSLTAQPFQGRDREMTFSSSTLLGIFFAIALLCSLFFAFGYTLGRSAPAEAGTAQAATIPAVTGSVSSFLPKPSAASQASTPAPASQASQADSSEQQSTADDAPPQPAAQAQNDQSPEVKSALPTLKLASAEKPVNQVDHTALPVIASGTLVQIAAIANPADADVLIRALRKRGYEINVRREPTDSLIHVQLGPFSTRAEASAMRQKLLSDGYNAMLK